MKSKWLLIGVALLVTVFAIGAVACSDDDEDEDEAPTATEEQADDVADDDVADDDADDMVLQLVASLTEVDGSGASGEASISPDGDGIEVTLSMAGLTEGAHANHLHHGTCPDDPPGEVHITLDVIEADENGDGLQTTSNDEQSIDHFAEGHYLAVHADDGAIISCGDVIDALA